MKPEELYEKKRRCENAIHEIRFEITQVESYPDSPSKQKKLERLDTELTLEYESLEHYKHLIFNLSNE